MMTHEQYSHMKSETGMKGVTAHVKREYNPDDFGKLSESGVNFLTVNERLAHDSRVHANSIAVIELA